MADPEGVRTSKSKLEGAECWAVEWPAQETLDHLMALTHYLLRMFREMLAREHGGK